MLIENYVNIVIRFFKSTEKVEIKKEVMEMIYSNLEELYGEKNEYTDEECKVVLKKIGDPNILAIKYSRLPKRLIGEKYIGYFYYMLIIGLISVFSITILVTVVRMATDFSNVWEHAVLGILGTIWSMFAVLGMLTLLFSVLEYDETKASFLKEYDPSKLTKKIKNKKEKYSIVEQIFDIILSVVFIILVLFIGVFKINGITIFDSEYFMKMYSLVLISMGAKIVKSIFYIKNHNQKTASTISLGFIVNIIGIIVWILFVMNGNFLTEEIRLYWAGMNGGLDNFFNTSWPNKFNIIVIAIACIGAVGNVISYLVQLYIFMFYNIDKLKKEEILSI